MSDLLFIKNYVEKQRYPHSSFLHDSVYLQKFQSSIIIMTLDSKKYRCAGAEKIIAILNACSSPEKALSLTELLEAVNKNERTKKDKLCYSNIRRLVRNVEKSDEAHKLGYEKYRNTVKYFVLNDQYLLDKEIGINKLNKIESNSLSKDTTTNNNEQSYYPEILNFLNKNNVIDNEIYDFKIWGERRSNGKWQNPDLVGSNISSEGNPHKLVSVEVKVNSSETEILVGIAQCCIYRTFSDYVLLFCFLDTNKNTISNKVINICEYYGIGLCLINEKKYTVPPRQNDRNNRDHTLFRKIYDEYVNT